MYTKLTGSDIKDVSVKIVENIITKEKLSDDLKNSGFK